MVEGPEVLRPSLRGAEAHSKSGTRDTAPDLEPTATGIANKYCTGVPPRPGNAGNGPRGRKRMNGGGVGSGLL